MAARFVLVHGDFHRAWCWERTIPELDRHPGKLEPGRPVGCVRLLECAGLVVSKVQPERRDGFGQVMRFGCSDDRGGDDGVAEHPCQRWLLAQQTWIVPIPGTRRRERLAENAAATRVALSADEIADPNTAAARIGVHGNRYNDLHMGLVDR